MSKILLVVCFDDYLLKVPINKALDEIVVLDEIIKIKIREDEFIIYQKSEIHVRNKEIFPLFIHHKYEQAYFDFQKDEYGYYELLDHIIIGRDKECHILYHYPTVSKMHCLIYKEDDSYYIKDLNSKNGIYLNGKKVKNEKLSIGDEIIISGIVLYFDLIFIYMPIPNFTTLKLFKNQPVALKQEKKVFPIIYKNIDLPKLVKIKKHHFAFFDLLLMGVYPLLMLFMQNNTFNHSFIYISLIIFLLRFFYQFILFMSDSILQLIENKRYKKLNDRYFQNLENAYPNCKDLAGKIKRLGKLLVKNEMVVRIGKKDHQVFLHDFKKYPHLVIVGDKNQGQLVARQILYQLGIYYPNIKVVFDKISVYDYLNHMRFNLDEEVLYVSHQFQKGYWIEVIENYHDACFGFDAIIDLYNHHYISDYSYEVDFDLFDVFLYQSIQFRLFHQFSSNDQSYLSLFHKTLQQARNDYLVEKELTGIIGIKDNHPIYLDLFEAKDGPHFLVSGMTGSGKSEWLLSYLMSLAYHYSSFDVSFFLIDFKGGGLSESLKDLHHTTMTLTNLDESQMERAIASLEDEILYREKLFLDISNMYHISNMNIHVFKKIRNKYQLNEDISHLLIVIDEFAEMKQKYPDVLDSFIRISRIGRSLGIHLILATQHPSGIVNHQILSNMTSIIGLKVASKQDSYELLNSDLAFKLTQPGSFYFVSRNNDLPIYGKSLLIDSDQSLISLYNHNFQLISRRKKEKNKRPFIELKHSINQVTPKAKQLYYRDFEDVNIQDLLIIDDYTHRQMKDYSLSHSILIFGLSMDIIEKLKQDYPVFCIDDSSSHELGIYYTNKASISIRVMESFRDILIFDDLYKEQITLKKTSLKTDISKGIGIISIHKELYLCKINPKYI